MKNNFKTYNEKKYIQFLRNLKNSVLDQKVSFKSKEQLLFLILKDLIEDNELRTSLIQTVTLNQFLNGYDAYLQLEETINYSELSNLFEIIKQIITSKAIFLITKEEFIDKFYSIFMKTEIKPIIINDSICFKWENDLLEYLCLLSTSLDHKIILDKILNYNNKVLYKK